MLPDVIFREDGRDVIPQIATPTKRIPITNSEQYLQLWGVLPVTRK
jgi:hypothetical protein